MKAANIQILNKKSNIKDACKNSTIKRIQEATMN